VLSELILCLLSDHDFMTPLSQTSRGRVPDFIPPHCVVVFKADGYCVWNFGDIIHPSLIETPVSLLIWFLAVVVGPLHTKPG
jgi:hypothetical protein